MEVGGGLVGTGLWGGGRVWDGGRCRVWGGGRCRVVGTGAWGGARVWGGGRCWCRVVEGVGWG